MSKILVTGGAGYIGSHVVKTLMERSHEILVIDNLSKGYRDSVLSGEFRHGDVGDTGLMTAILQEFRPDAIMHFAGFIEVGESVVDPLRYYANNVGSSTNLLTAMERAGTDKIIFSSSAAVYGIPEEAPVPEEALFNPINPYGHSKAHVEQMLNDQSSAGKVRYVALRYFNAAGADPGGRLGERHSPESHLIPLALKTAKGKRESISVYGNDYATPDGTCIRDYVHVNDLSDAHAAALEYLLQGGKSDALNCGYGHGYSVREVVQMAKKVTNIDFAVQESGRREGDPPVLVAKNEKIRRVLGWKPKNDDLEYIIRTAWKWEQSQP